MVRILNTVMTERRGRLLTLLLFAGLFVLVVVSLLSFVRYRVDAAARAEVRAALTRESGLERQVEALFARYRSMVTQAPCSDAFLAQLRRLALEPDGVNEFFYASGGRLLCSSSRRSFADTAVLGPPDIVDGEGMVWLDRDLAPFDLAGLTSSVVTVGNLGMVVPPRRSPVPPPSWLAMEVVIRLADGRFWHRDGTFDLYKGHLADADAASGELVCDDRQRYCAVYHADPVRFFSGRLAELLLVLMFLAGAAAGVAALVRRAIRHFSSFDSRFRRNLNSDTIVCSYQPVMDLRSGRIVGCEVLARWRDVDGSVIMPDRFIPLVEREGMTLEFTRSIVEKAMRELSAALPADVRLTVAFNVFPADLADPQLPEVFRVCQPERDRFAIIAEIVESAAFDNEAAAAQVEALRREGVGVYLDDFGAGYSNIQNLAALPVEGVKLDRAFAMAPDDSMMARMLVHAVGLIKVSGRVIVVEGVETLAKVEQLRNMGATVDRVQGYHISRPLPIDALADFLVTPPAEEGRRTAA